MLAELLRSAERVRQGNEPSAPVEAFDQSVLQRHNYTSLAVTHVRGKTAKLGSVVHSDACRRNFPRSTFARSSLRSTCIPSREDIPDRRSCEESNRLLRFLIVIHTEHTREASLNKSPRFQPIDRTQDFLQTIDVESFISEDDRARAVWLFLTRLSLSRFSVDRRAFEG
jgi:hypothetical protein